MPLEGMKWQKLFQMLKFLDMLHALKFHRYLLRFFNKMFTCKRFISHSEQWKCSPLTDYGTSPWKPLISGHVKYKHLCHGTQWCHNSNWHAQSSRFQIMVNTALHQIWCYVMWCYYGNASLAIKQQQTDLHELNLYLSFCAGNGCVFIYVHIYSMYTCVYIFFVRLSHVFSVFSAGRTHSFGAGQRAQQPRGGSSADQSSKGNLFICPL